MSDLLIISFDDEKSAFELDAHLRGLRRMQRLETQDTTIVTRDPDGRIDLHSAANVPVLQTVGGAVWGAVLGAVFLVPGPGAVAGAAIGALNGQIRDPGVPTAFLEEIARTLPCGGSALCVLVRDMEAEALHREMEAFPKAGHLIQSPLDPEAEARLRAQVEATP